MASKAHSDLWAALFRGHGEKIRYLIVGVWNTAFGYALFVLLLAVVGPSVQALSTSSNQLVALIGRNYYLVAQWLGWLVAVPQSTATMRFFVFGSSGRLLPQIGRAYFIYLPAQALSSVILWLTVRVLHMSPPLGALITILVTTVFSYIGHKYFTFRVPLEVGEVYEPDAIGFEPSSTSGTHGGTP